MIDVDIWQNTTEPKITKYVFRTSSRNINATWHVWGERPMFLPKASQTKIKIFILFNIKGVNYSKFYLTLIYSINSIRNSQVLLWNYQLNDLVNWTPKSLNPSQFPYKSSEMIKPNIYLWKKLYSVSFYMHTNFRDFLGRLFVFCV